MSMTARTAAERLVADEIAAERRPGVRAPDSDLVAVARPLDLS